MTEQPPPPYTLDNLTGQPPARRRRRWPWIAAAAVVAVALATGLTIWLAAPSLADQAVERCQAEVTGRLKAPATAEHTGIQIEERRNGHWAIDGQVDSQNSFGALVRTGWHCELYTPDDGATWAVNTVRLT